MEQNNNTRRVISLLVDNSNGVLARISSLFCRRGFKDVYKRQMKGAFRSTSMTWRNWAAVISIIGMRLMIPALLTSTLMWPCLLYTSDIDAATCSESAKGEQPAAPETITLTRKEGSADSIRLMTGVKSPMRFTDSGNGHKVTVSFDESVFTNGVLWQQDAESFVCMEPWNGWANSVNEAGHHIELNPGESKEFKWSVTIG